MSKILAIIPARGGSKGVPRKNIVPLGGQPLIYHTIKVAQACKLLDRVILSSEDEEIIEVAKGLGVEVPFVRPMDLALDHVSDRPVMQHAVETLETTENYSPDYIIILKPTIPFRSLEDIENVVNKLKENKSDSVRTVTKSEGVYHPYWMFTLDEDGVAQPMIPDKTIDKYYRRQLLPPVYRLNGVVDGMSRDVLMNHSKLYGDKMALVEVPENRAIDIDTIADLEYAEFLIQKRNREKTS